jgi:hypothetical protein
VACRMLFVLKPFLQRLGKPDRRCSRHVS